MHLYGPPHPPELVEKARMLWEENLTAQEIARRLVASGLTADMSKNAVIGLAHRNGFPSRGSPLFLRKEQT